MSWSDAQKRMFLTAATAAGWNDQQRYMAMRHAGCPDTERNPVSVRNRFNNQSHFELCMDLAESSAGMNGRTVPRPRHVPSWRHHVQMQRDRQATLIAAIWSEAQSRLPVVFRSGGLDGFVRRMTCRDAERAAEQGLPIAPIQPEDIGECDPGQMYRIHEGLKKWVAREFIQRGLEPESFTLTRGETDQLRRTQREIAHGRRSA